MDILKGKRYDIMNVLWEEGRPLSAFEINDIAPELKMPTVRRCLELLLKENIIKVAGTSMNKKLYPSSFKRGLLKRKCQKQKDKPGRNDDSASGIRWNHSRRNRTASETS